MTGYDLANDDAFTLYPYFNSSATLGEHAEKVSEWIRTSGKGYDGVFAIMFSKVKKRIYEDMKKFQGGIVCPRCERVFETHREFNDSHSMDDWLTPNEKLGVCKMCWLGIIQIQNYPNAMVYSSYKRASDGLFVVRFYGLAPNEKGGHYLSGSSNYGGDDILMTEKQFQYHKQYFPGIKYVSKGKNESILIDDDWKMP